MSRQEIVAALGGRQLCELMGPEFRDRFSLEPPSQYGMVCADVGANIIGLISTYFACFDTRDELGIWLEIAQYRMLGRHRPPTEASISRLARLQRRGR
jgi:hypothetical protein